MKLKQAQELIEAHENGDCEECFEGDCADEARGYLEGYAQGVEQEQKKAKRLVNAVRGLSHGVDWNNGTHAKAYRQEVLDALSAYESAQ